MPAVCKVQLVKALWIWETRQKTRISSVDMFVEKLCRGDSYIQLWNVHYWLFIQMGNELVTVDLHLTSMHFEVLLGDIDAHEKIMLESVALGDNPAPMVFPSLLAKEFAPLKNADIEKIGIHSAPKIVF